MATLSPITGSLNGVSLQLGDRVAVIAQTTTAENGIYAVGVTGSELGPGGSFVDSSTPKAVTTVAGRCYYWVKGAGTDRLVNGTQTLYASGTFTAQGTSVNLYGTGATTCTDSLKACGLSRATDAPTSALTAGRAFYVCEGTVGAGLWTCTGGAYTFAAASAPSAAATGVSAFTTTAPAAITP